MKLYEFKKVCRMNPKKITVVKGVERTTLDNCSPEWDFDEILEVYPRKIVLKSGDSPLDKFLDWIDCYTFKPMYDTPTPYQDHLFLGYRVYLRNINLNNAEHERQLNSYEYDTLWNEFIAKLTEYMQNNIYCQSTVAANEFINTVKDKILCNLAELVN